MKKLIYFIILFLLGPPLGLLAQTTTGELRISVTDGKDPLEFAAVGVLLNNSLVVSASTDSLGRVVFKHLNPGLYDVKVILTGYDHYYIKKVEIGMDRPTSIIVPLVETVIDQPPVVVTPKEYIPKMIKTFEISKEFTNIQDNPNRGNMNALLNTGARIFSVEGGATSIVGSRPGSMRVYWNGVAVNNMSLAGIPSRALQNVSALTGAVSAEYGDFVGGAAIFTTPRPGLNTVMSIEGISSSLFDKYHNNYAEFFRMAPLVVKDKGRANARTVLGYILSANFQYQADRSPSAIGVWRVKPDKLKELEANPIQASPKGQGFVPTAEFIKASDLERVSYHENVPSANASVITEFNLVPDSRRQLLVGAKYDYMNATNYNFGNNLFNAANNSKSISHNLLTYINFNHIIKDENDKNNKGPIKSASYNIRLDYQSAWAQQQDAVHGDRFFDYGYVGRFKTYSAPAYEFRGMGEAGEPDSLTIDGQTIYLKNYYRQTGNRPNDTLVTFDRSNTRNPIRANYTSLYYDLLGQENINTLSGIRGSSAGLVNGQNPIGVYSNMWNNVGMGVEGFGKSQSEQMGVNANAQFTTGIHEVRFGVYYEQRIQRGWSVDANSLWPLMGQLANNGLELDRDNPILVRDENGTFMDTVKYNYRQNASQSEFDKRFRAQLMQKGATDHYGNPITENTFIDINSYDPSEFSLSLFTADELLNNGNGFVNYFGYDYKGNKTRGIASIGDFTGDTLNRPVSAYMPSYAAAFIQDKLTFKSFTVRAGLRLERYDNNLPVLEDPYLLFPALTAGEVKTVDGKDVNHPTTIGEDYTVYVDDARKPTEITGYRKENVWYNASGQRVADPSVIAQKSKTSTIQPWLANPAQKRVDATAFTDFKPGMLVLPRLYFDFPVIDDVSRFFASYDVLAQRPGNNVATIANYYFLPFNSTGIINNPNLKPQVTTNYEVGFSQRISARSAITLIASYREQRNLIQLFRYNYAYPVSYTSFANIDFSTIKSFTAQYNFRDWGKFDIEASYTLQFADGTGSAPGSQQALVAVGQPNLRTLFPLSFDVRHNIKMNMGYNFGSGETYKGPVLFKTKVLANAGWAVNLNAYSGLPYTANTLPTPDAQSGIPVRSPIKGTPFGSRLPWQLQNDLSIFKEAPVKLGKTKEGLAKMGMLRFTLWINNFLNVKNIRAIHAYTGSATADGWLSSEQGRRAIEDAVSSQAFVDLYNTALANPGYYTMPRRIRLGVSLNF